MPGESLLSYKNPRVAQIPPNTYKKFMLDPVLIFRGPHSKMEGISQHQAQLMADTFYALIYQEVSKDYEMVGKPGPDTLRAQVAITHLEESWPMLDVVSTIPAPMNAFARVDAQECRNWKTGVQRRSGDRGQSDRLTNRRGAESGCRPTSRRKETQCRVIQLVG